MFHVYSTCLSESGPNFIPNHFKQVFGLVVFTRKSGGSLQFRLWVILYSRFYVTVAIVLALSYLYKDCIINYNNIKFRLLIKCNFSGHSLSLVDFFFFVQKMNTSLHFRGTSIHKSNPDFKMAPFMSCLVQLL